MTTAARPGRLKICLLSEPLHAGVGRHVVDLASGLADRGHDVHVIYSPIRLQPEFLARISESPGIRTMSIAMRREVGTHDLRAFELVRRYIREHGPFDILHGHSSKAGAYARLLKLAGTQAAVLYTPHAFITMSTSMTKIKRRAFGLIEWTLAGLTDRLICVSRDEQRHAIALGIPEHRASVVINGVPGAPSVDRANVRRRLGASEREIVVGFVGRLDDQKAPERLVGAVLGLAQRLPHLTLAMVGDGPKREGLERQAADRGFAGRVRWLGAVDGRALMPGFDIFVLPSRYEAFPYVLLEALDAGLPIVTTPVGGVDETIAHGVNGFVVSHHDGNALTNTIAQLASDSIMRERMGAASRQRATLFTVEKMVEGTERLYREVLSSREVANPEGPDEALLIEPTITFEQPNTHTSLAP